MGEAKRRREAEAAKDDLMSKARITQLEELSMSQGAARGMQIQSELARAGKAPGQSDGAPLIEISCPTCGRQSVGSYKEGPSIMSFSYPPHDGAECVERAKIGNDPEALYCSRFKPTYLKALSDYSEGFNRSSRRKGSPPANPRRGKSVIEM